VVQFPISALSASLFVIYFALSSPHGTIRAMWSAVVKQHVTLGLRKVSQEIASFVSDLCGEMLPIPELKLLSLYSPDYFLCSSSISVYYQAMVGSLFICLIDNQQVCFVFTASFIVHLTLSDIV
jgi:hypothetical protein